MLHKEVDARKSGLNSVLKAGKELLKTKVGEDKTVLKQKIAALSQEWDDFVTKSSDRLEKINTVYEKARSCKVPPIIKPHVITLFVCLSGSLCQEKHVSLHIADKQNKENWLLACLLNYK